MTFARKSVCWAVLAGLTFISGCLESDLSTDNQAGNARPARSPLPKGARSATPTIGEPPPEIAAMHWLNTETPPSLAALQGKVVLVEFWATWCGPCVQGIPHLNDLYEHYREQGLQIVSLTEESLPKVKQFQKRTRNPIQYAVGTGSMTSHLYRVKGIPRAFIIGRDGNLLWTGHPATPECEDQLVAALQQEYSADAQPASVEEN